MNMATTSAIEEYSFVPADRPMNRNDRIDSGGSVSNIPSHRSRKPMVPPIERMIDGTRSNAMRGDIASDNSVVSDEFLRYSRKAVLEALEWPMPTFSRITDRVQRLAPTMHAIVASKAARSGIHLLRVSFSEDYDPEDDETSLSMVITAELTGIQAMVFWESLDEDISRWTEKLSDSDREFVIHRLGIRFAWTKSSS